MIPFILGLLALPFLAFLSAAIFCADKSERTRSGWGDKP